MSDQRGQATRAIRGRIDRDQRGAVYPIYHATTYVVDQTDEYERYLQGDEDFILYSRIQNPTVRNAENKLAATEEAEDAVLFSSGMAAISSAILAFARAGDTIAAARRLYGATYQFLHDLATSLGISVIFLDPDELYRVDELAPTAKLVYFETPVNPTTFCVDIEAVVSAARHIQALTMVDNTFASPVNQNPHALGVDVVVHSATKYIGGHSDVLAGAAMGSHESMQALRQMRTLLGGALSPREAAEIDRSLKTLTLRVAQHNANAQRLAAFFAEHPKIQRVYYPGLPDSPGHAIAQKQMRGYGGMLTLDMGTLEAAKTLCDHLQIALNAVSLGGVETLVSVPLYTSHAKMSEAERAAAGVTPGMVRVSAGLEDIDDLIADFAQALSHV